MIELQWLGLRNMCTGRVFRPASDDNPPSGPKGIGRAAIENETSRSRLCSFSSGTFSSSTSSMTGGGCEK